MLACLGSLDATGGPSVTVEFNQMVQVAQVVNICHAVQKAQVFHIVQIAQWNQVDLICIQPIG